VRLAQIRKEESSMHHRLLRSHLAALILTVAVTLVASAQTPQTAFIPFGEPDLLPQDITADGSKVVGVAYLGAPYFTWTRSQGIVKIGGGGNAGQPAISGDGSTIFGTTFDENGIGQAARWLGGTQWQLLGSVEGGVNCDSSLSSGYDISYDGRLGVGLAWLPKQCSAQAASWDLVDGGPATGLGTLVPNRSTRANTISGDGHVIAGWQDSDVGIRQGARWVDGVEMVLLTAAGAPVGEVQHTNYDGTVMVGLYYPFGSDDGWLWTQSRGFTALTSPSLVFKTAIPIAATEDGALVFGAVRERFRGTTRAVFWRNGKATYLRDYLAARGLAAGWDTRYVTAASADGGTLTGWGINPNGRIEGFVIADFR
jgi:uncharacterized membrane protein